MKKYFISFAVLILAVVLSGCTLLPAGNSGSASQKTTVSKSVWKSTDGGKTWTVKNTTDGKPQATDWDILKIAVSPADSNNIFVGLKNGGMMMSTDGGDSWKQTNFISAKVYGLEINPVDGKTLYVSGVWQGRGKIFKSVDRGENWKEIYTAAADGPLIVAMKLDRSNPETIFAATSDNLVIKSSDGGESWRSVFESDSAVTQIETGAAGSNLVYLLDLDGKISRSRDGGENFSEVTPADLAMSLSGGGFNVIKIDPVSGAIWAAGTNGILRSNNSGDTWDKVNVLNDAKNSPITALAIDPSNPRHLSYGTLQAAYYSIDGGANWKTFQFEASKSISVIEFDPKDSNVIWAGFKK